MIGLKDVSMVFNPGTVNQSRAIRCLNLAIKEGDFITVIGSNGAGKTTFLNLISGSLIATEGSITVNNRNITRVSEYKRAFSIGRIFQNPLLGTAGGLTIEENMLLAHKKGMKGLGISLNHRLREEFKSELKALDMGLEGRLHERVDKLSGGQRQALTLLMAVLSRPALLLLDEHTAALDPKNAALVMDLTRRFIDEYRLTALMVTHHMAHAIVYGNRLLMMDAGEVILDCRDEEKHSLTVEKLVQRFHDLRHRDFEDDKNLLE